MISPKVILRHLQEYLSKLTNDFSTVLACTGEIVTGTPQILRLTTVTAHGLSAGRQIIVNNALVNNKITAVQFYDSEHVIRFTTAQKHDLTEDYDRNLFSGKRDCGTEFISATITGTTSR